MRNRLDQSVLPMCASRVNRTLTTWASILLLSLPCFAQNNSVTVSAVGDFNPTTYVYLHYQTSAWEPTFFSSKSALGGAAEYQRWLSPHWAIGVEVEGNPSDLHLVPETYPISGFEHYITPLDRFQGLVSVTYAMPIKYGLAPYVQAGAGSVVTYGNQPGWSHDFAAATGFGLMRTISGHWVARVGTTVLFSEQGCFGDPTCKQSEGTTFLPKLGLMYSF